MPRCFLRSVRDERTIEERFAFAERGRIKSRVHGKGAQISKTRSGKLVNRRAKPTTSIQNIPVKRSRSGENPVQKFGGIVKYRSWSYLPIVTRWWMQQEGSNLPLFSRPLVSVEIIEPMLFQTKNDVLPHVSPSLEQGKTSPMNTVIPRSHSEILSPNGSSKVRGRTASKKETSIGDKETIQLLVNVGKDTAMQQEKIKNDDNTIEAAKSKPTNQNPRLKGPSNDIIRLRLDRSSPLPFLLKCYYCSSFFRTLQEYGQHITTHMDSNFRHQCPFCSKSFKRNWLLKVHIRVHTGERPFKCTTAECTKRFSDKSNLRAHLRTHIKSNICGNCGKSFAQKRDLRKHVAFCGQEKNAH